MFQFSNFCSATLKNAVTPGDTTIVFDKTTYQLVMGKPQPFPTPKPGYTYHVVLENTTVPGMLEILEVTGFDGNETLTVKRDSVSPLNIPLADVGKYIIELRVMSAALNNFLQKDNVTDDGYYDFESIKLSVDELMMSTVTDVLEIKVGSNTLTLPKSGNRLMWGNRRLQTTGTTSDSTPIGAIMPWDTRVGNIPSGWVVCDGKNSTPDLVGKFIIGGVPGAYVAGDLTAGTGASDNWKLGGNTAGETDKAGRDWWYPVCGAEGGHSDMTDVTTSADTSHPVPNIPIAKHSHGVTLHTVPTSLGLMAAAPGTSLSLYVAGDSATGKYLTTKAPSSGSKPVLKTFDATLLAATTATIGSTTTTQEASIASQGTSTSFGHEHVVDITPPYYALVYIMKVS